MRKFINEPITAFLFIGVLLYLAHSLILQSDQASAKKIIISPEQKKQLIAQFSRTWMRAPTETEFQNLIQNYIRDEVYYREAMAMGLDQDDPVLRQRLRQKLEMLMDNMATATVPGDQVLMNYMNENREKFRLDHRLSFIQVYLNPEDHRNLVSDAQAILKRLNDGADPLEVGDPALIDFRFNQLTGSEITQQFGIEFTEEILKITPGKWTGPVNSGFGAHLILVTERIDGRMPELSEIRRIVEREWMSERTKEVKNAAYQKLLENYEVVYEENEADE